MPKKSEDFPISDDWSNEDFGKWIMTTLDEPNVKSISILRQNGKKIARVHYK